MTNTKFKLSDKEFIMLVKKQAEMIRKSIDEQKAMPYTFSVHPEITHKYKDIMIKATDDTLEAFERLIKIYDTGEIS